MGVHHGEVRLIARAVEVPRGSLDELQQSIGIAFRDITLLQEALTHSSFANESPHISPRDNERLEYLGDAVLQLITAEYLYKVRPGAAEGEMTQVRSAMVNTNTLASLSEALGMGRYLFLGKGISKGGGRNLKSLLANAFEAVLGAVFLDQGYDAAYHYYLDRFRSLPDPVADENHKGRLQQVVQEKFGQTPFYDSAGARGTGQGREYTAVVFAGAQPLGTGHAHTKQEAEQKAAKAALDSLLGGGQQPAATAPTKIVAERPARAPRTRSRRAAPPPAVAGEPELADPGPGAGGGVTEALPVAVDPAPAAAPAPAPPAPASQQFGALPAETIVPAAPAPTVPAEPVPRVPRVQPEAAPAPAIAPGQRPPDPPRFEFGALPAEPAESRPAPEAPEAAEVAKPRRAPVRRRPAKPASTAQEAIDVPVPAEPAGPPEAPRRAARPRRRPAAKTPPVE